jgi:predicted negative regulator of RcsB-dependent stress response
MSEATQTQTLEQTLNKTDLGHTVYENRKVFFAALITVLVGSMGYLGWKQQSHKSAQESSLKVFEFQNGTWADVKSGKAPATDLAKAFDSLDESAKKSPVMVPVALEMGKFLYEKGQLAEADSILSKIDTKHPVSSFFVGMQRSAILEKLGKTDEAIAVLEPMAQNKEALMPAKISLDLGRLYLLKGEKGKAQTQFDYIINTFPNDDQAKLAKLYLSQITK